MPAQIIVDDGVPSPKREKALELMAALLKDRPHAHDLLAVVTRLPSGRLTVFVNHIDDPTFTAAIEAALARL